MVGSLAAGVFPILWGLCIDLLKPVKANWMGMEWNQFSIYFVVLIAVLVAVIFLVRRLEEASAAPMDEFVLDLIRNSPLRSWLRE